MLIKLKNANRLVPVLLVIAIVLTTPDYLPFKVAQANPNQSSRSQQTAHKVSPLLKGNKHKPDETVTLIVTLGATRSARLNAFLSQNGVRHRREMKSLGYFSLALPFRMVNELAAFPEVVYLSSNEKVSASGHVTETTGASAGQAAAVASGRGTIDGSGIRIAILDSGIDINHAQFSSAGGGSRVLASVDFTGENRTDDPYGHGTFVAAAAAGGAGAGAAYTGIAPGASLLNVRVLNSTGQGTVEGVLAGLDWVATNARQYNIRIVNLSLGTRAVESYKYDVLCRAVRGLVNSGILVFAAAGNEGKNVSGQKVYGAIHSPGNEPSAFTIGASNTFQTGARGDDGVATYSSRGPTRSYWLDEDGVAHHDNLLKPELIAPGNKLVFAQAHNNLIVTLNPTLNESAPHHRPGDESDADERNVGRDSNRSRRGCPNASTQSKTDAEHGQGVHGIHGAEVERFRSSGSGSRSTECRRRDEVGDWRFDKIWPHRCRWVCHC